MLKTVTNRCKSRICEQKSKRTQISEPRAAMGAAAPGHVAQQTKRTDTTQAGRQGAGGRATGSPGERGATGSPVMRGCRGKAAGDAHGGSAEAPERRECRSPAPCALPPCLPSPPCFPSKYHARARLLPWLPHLQGNKKAGEFHNPPAASS